MCLLAANPMRGPHPCSRNGPDNGGAVSFTYGHTLRRPEGVPERILRPHVQRALQVDYARVPIKPDTGVSQRFDAVGAYDDTFVVIIPVVFLATVTAGVPDDVRPVFRRQSVTDSATHFPSPPRLFAVYILPQCLSGGFGGVFPIRTPLRGLPRVLGRIRPRPTGSPVQVKFEKRAHPVEFAGDVRQECCGAWTRQAVLCATCPRFHGSGVRGTCS